MVSKAFTAIGHGVENTTILSKNMAGKPVFHSDGLDTETVVPRDGLNRRLPINQLANLEIRKRELKMCYNVR